MASSGTAWTPSQTDTDGESLHARLYATAEACLPGAGLGGYSLPEDVRFVIRRGRGSRLEDVRGRWYIDYVGGAGALILGHAHPAVVAAVREQAEKGIHYFGTLNEAAIELAERLVSAIPCADKVVYTTTGSEATFYAMRMARAFTGRDKILKFEGAYHGNHDYSTFSIFPSALSNYPMGRPDTGGVPEAVQPTVLVAPYNDLDAAARIVAQHRSELAAVIVEPVQRVIFPQPDFLPGVRRICDENGVLLVFDEVVTGFRLALGGAQEYFGVTPDLASYGKIVGGGGPLGCVAGRADIVDRADPRNKGKPDYAYINGTLHGNPVAAAAGLATLRELERPGFYEDLHAKSDALCRACQSVLDGHGLPAVAAGRASLWQILFMDRAPRSHADVMASDTARAKALDIESIRQGLYVLPNVRRFVSAVHTDEDLEDTVRALDAACGSVA
ncbi:MAG: aminotransferase class III-fold pyridoxal phosphate-dependent enzyme [Gammaproteobacteria bacterium]|nr:aminotransferase class III-fold pyridoxal phosphate-dependent enzyme [Gammaproteobacteria bacterium]